MEYLGTIYKGSQSDIIFPVPFIELSDGATVDFYTDGNGGFSRTKDEIKIDNYMLKTTASADELNSLADGVLNYTINTCMGKSEGDTGLYLSEPTSYVDRQYLTADNVKTINGESIVGQGDIEIQGGGSDDYVWEWGWYPYETATTDFTADELQSAIDAYESGKRIIIKYKDYYIYPYFMDFDTNTFTLSYNNDDEFYKFTYKDDNSQSISKTDSSDIYIIKINNESDLPSLNLNKDEINSVAKAIGNNKHIIIDNGTYQYTVINSYLSSAQVKLTYGLHNQQYMVWTGNLTSYQNYSQIIRLQKEISGADWLNIKNINLANNKDVNTILTKLRTSANTTNKNIQELSGNVSTALEGYNKLDGIVGRHTTDIDVVKNSIGALNEDLTTLSGSVQDNYYTRTEVDTRIANIDGKIPTKTSQLTNDSGYLTEHQSLNEYYTKSESDTNYASKTDTYTKEEIDSKIGDINNILESI